MRSACISLCVIFVMLVAVSAQADVVTDWNTFTLNLIKVHNVPPPAASRALAMVHVAIYDSVNTIGRQYKPYLIRTSCPSGAVSWDCAASTAAYRVLIYLFPQDYNAIQAELLYYLNKTPNKSAQMNGFYLGAYIGNLVVSCRKNDGANKIVPYVPGTLPGQWRPTPPGYAPALLPNWPYVKPFAMTSGSQFRVAGPPALDSEEYADALAEVKSLGAIDSTTRTDDETQIAYFWADGAGTVTPPGHWNLIAQQIAEMEGNSLYDNARLFALLNIALADAAISAWDDKYYFNFWRPITAIREGSVDPDSNWQPLLVTPPFPECVSGHSTFSGAGSTILAQFFGNDISFTLPSLSPFAGPRSYDSFSEAADEAGRSRIYGGIHFEFSNSQGLSAGHTLGDYVWANFMQPIR